MPTGGPSAVAMRNGVGAYPRSTRYCRKKVTWRLEAMPVGPSGEELAPSHPSVSTAGTKAKPLAPDLPTALLLFLATPAVHPLGAGETGTGGG